jgi:drug/metabolite transporter (DMT)-like permease
VLFVPVLCFIFWREGVSRVTLVGLSAAVTGLFLMAGGSVDGFSLGDFLSMVCAVFIAVHIIAVSKILKDEDVFLVTMVQFATVTLMSGTASMMFSPPLHSFGPATAGALVYCAIFPTVICFTLQNTFQRYTTPAQAGLIYTLDPIWSMLGGFAILGERFSMGEWLGCAMILIGVMIPVAAGLLFERKYVTSSSAGACRCED